MGAGRLLVRLSGVNSMTLDLDFGILTTLGWDTFFFTGVTGLRDLTGFTGDADIFTGETTGFLTGDFTLAGAFLAVLGGDG